MRKSIVFKYHPDDTIYQEGKYLCTFEQYIAINPTSNLVQGHFFELLDDGSLTVIDDEGHHGELDPAIHWHIPQFLNNPYPTAAEISAALQVLFPKNITPNNGGDIVTS